jgi:hypothetical protein
MLVVAVVVAMPVELMHLVVQVAEEQVVLEMVELQLLEQPTSAVAVVVEETLVTAVPVDPEL